MKRTRAEWVVAGGKIGEMAHCTRCGEGLEIGGSQRIQVALAAMNAFIKCHLHCKEGGFKEPAAVTPQKWLEGRDTGISSCTIYAVMENKPTPMREYDTPHDPDDFGRCYRLLNSFPNWRKRLPEVAQRFPSWVPMIREWDRLTQMYEAALKTPKSSATAMYDLMQKLKKEGRA